MEIDESPFLNLLGALSAAAISEQQAVSAVEAVLDLLSAQISARGLCGGIALVDDEGDTLIIRRVFSTPEIKRVLDRLQKLAGVQVENMRLSLDDLPLYRQVLTERKAQYVPDSQSLLESVFKTLDKTRLKAKVQQFSKAPGIYVPLMSGGEILGVLNLVGEELTSADVPNVQALANQVANALGNARLLHQMESALQQAKDSEQQVKQAHEELQRQAEETSALLTSAETIALLDLGEVLPTIGGNAKRLFQADGVRIHLLDKDTKTLHCVVALHPQPERVMSMRLQLGEGFVGMVALTGEPEIVGQAMGNPRGVPIPGTTMVPESLVVIPLKARSEVIGVMTVQRYGTDHPFHEDDLPLLQAFANQAAVSISNAQLFDETQRQASELASLYEMATTIGTAVEMEPLMDALSLQINALLSPDAFGVLLYLPERQEMQVLYVYENWKTIKELFGRYIPMQEIGLTRWVVENQKSLLVHDLVVDEIPSTPLNLTDEDVRGWLSVPLLVRDRLIGVISVQSLKAGAFTERDRRFLESMAVQIAISLENVRLLEAERQQREQTETLRQVAEVLNSALEREEVLDMILEQLAKVMAYDSAAVMLADGEHLQMVANRGMKMTSEESPILDIQNFPHIRQAMEERLPVMISDTHTDTRWTVLPGFEYIRNWLGAPLLFKGQSVGMLMLDKAEANYYTLDHARLISAFANQAAIAIENSRLLVSARRRANELNVLRETVTEISGEFDLPRLLHSVVERAVALLDAAGGELALYEPELDALRIVISYQMDENYTGRTQRIGRGLLGRAGGTGEPIIVQNYAAYEDRIGSAERPWRGVLAVPLKFHGKLVGVIAVVEAGTRSPFAETDLNLLNLFGQQAVIAIENARFAEDLASRLKETSALHDLARGVTSSLEMEQVLDETVKMLQQMFQARGVAITLVEDEKHLLIRASTGIRQEYVDAFRILIGDQVSGRVVASGQPLYIPDLHARTDLEKMDPLVHSLLVVPLESQGKTIGTLSIDSEAINAFSAYDERLLAIAAAQVAIAIENTRLYQEALSSANRLARLNQAAKEIAVASLDLEQIYLAAHRAAENLMPSEVFAITLLDESRDMIEAVYLMDRGVRATQVPISRERGLSGRVIANGITIRHDDFRAEAEKVDVQHFGGPEDVHSILAVPMRLGNKIIGMISAQSYQVGAYSEEDQNTLEVLGAQIAIAIDNAKLFAEVQMLAVTDPLLGIANRRAFDRVIENEVARAARYHHGVSLIFLDIDDFRVYNNQFGHPDGDERLKAIAHLLASSVRAPDIAARYGGDEFVLLLPHTDKAGAFRLAERLRQGAEAMARSATHVLEHAPGGLIPGYTMSIGVACFPEDARTVHGLLFAADQAELKAKHLGKNQVVSA